MLDARRVFIDEKLAPRFHEGDGNARHQAGDLAPADDVLVGLDLDVGLGAAHHAADLRDANGGAAILDLGAERLARGGGKQRSAGGNGAGGDEFASVQAARVFFIAHEGNPAKREGQISHR
jgi:hypothetical protein